MLHMYNYFTHYCQHVDSRADGRKSMPSVYMTMDLLLRHVNHESFYILPILQDWSLRTRVYKLYTEFVQYAVANGSGYFTTCGPEPVEVFVQRNIGVPVLHSRLASRSRPPANDAAAASRAAIKKRKSEKQ